MDLVGLRIEASVVFIAELLFRTPNASAPTVDLVVRDDASGELRTETAVHGLYRHTREQGGRIYIVAERRADTRSARGLHIVRHELAHHLETYRRKYRDRVAEERFAESYARASCKGSCELCREDFESIIRATFGAQDHTNAARAAGGNP